MYITIPFGATSKLWRAGQWLSTSHTWLMTLNGIVGSKVPPGVPAVEWGPGPWLGGDEQARPLVVWLRCTTVQVASPPSYQEKEHITSKAWYMYITSYPFPPVNIWQSSGHKSQKHYVYKCTYSTCTPKTHAQLNKQLSLAQEMSTQEVPKKYSIICALEWLDKQQPNNLYKLAVCPYKKACPS